MDVDRIAKPAGWFLSILGALTIGVSMGLGLESFMVKRRFMCGFAGQETDVVNITTACADVLGASGDMILVSAVGGAVAFFCGIAAMAYANGGDGRR